MNNSSSEALQAENPMILELLMFSQDCVPRRSSYGRHSDDLFY